MLIFLGEFHTFKCQKLAKTFRFRFSEIVNKSVLGLQNDQTWFHAKSELQKIPEISTIWNSDQNWFHAYQIFIRSMYVSVSFSWHCLLRLLSNLTCVFENFTPFFHCTKESWASNSMQIIICDDSARS